ncbi:MAG: ABC transporter ATP-binding protein [Lachnospiraceae bacterium]|jgi:putative ABC transport system ATP-binding protein|nr:ABC transporter ATP-binding protein [Lachnospiraceae bacterium]
MVKLEGITKTYQQGKLPVPVLQAIDLEVGEGEYVAIMGPSGSGKTTLMNLIGCLDLPTTGRYELDGRDIQSRKEKELAEIRNQLIGFVFQQFNLLPKETALSNVQLPLVYAGVPRKEREPMAKEALERVGLGERLNFRPNQLSGGQQQRVAIARALVNHPKVLLADEPTGALDTKAGIQVMKLFEELNREGVTIIMITHEPEIAECAKRIIVLRDGKIMEERTGRGYVQEEDYE